MAQLVVAAAGAALGGFLAPGIVAFGMSGASIGWMAGSMLGSAFAPTQKGAGPQLSDLSVSTSAYGTPIPYVQGHPRIAGQIVWASNKREIATTQEAGKGGGGSEYTTFTYEVDLLILLTDNEISGVSRVWSNGELVFDGNAKDNLWSRMTTYSGGLGQLPDPTYEAAVGTANAPAYRGRGSVFIQSLQLGGSGQIPNLTFEIGVSGLPALWTRSSNASMPVETDFDQYFNEIVTSSSFTSVYFRSSSPTPFARYVEINIEAGSNQRGWFFGAIRRGKWSLATGKYTANPYGNDGIYCVTNLNYFGGTPASFDNGAVTANAAFNVNWVGRFGIYINNDTGQIRVYKNGVIIQSWDAPFNDFDPWFCVYGANTTYTATIHRLSSSWVTSPSGAQGFFQNATVAEKIFTQPLQTVVSNLCTLSGLSNAQFDASALSTITRPVRSMAISSVSSARTVLDMLAANYHFEAVLSDKIYFRPRATAPAATLTFDELGVVVDGGNTPDPMPLTQANELEIPAQMALTYSNVDGDYQTDTQYSDRLLTGQESTSAMQVPLGFTATEAKQIVDAMLLDKAVSALTTSVTVGVDRAALEPTDVVLLTGEDGSTYRMRIAKKSEASGVTTLECVADDSTVFTQTGATAGGTASQTVVLPTPTTALELLDVPLLRDADNLPGHYVAVKGSASNWTSAGLFDSLDDLTFSPVTTISSQATIGTCATTLPAWAGGNVFDEVSTVTVNVGTQQLVSVTRDDILAAQTTNAALIGGEVVQYRSALLVSAGVYTLSGFLRGMRGTVSTGHVAAERFVNLSAGGLRFIPLQAGDLGRVKYYKAASAGQALSAVTSQAMTPVSVNLKPFAPVNARANRNAADTVITWTRQTRLSTRIVGTLGINSPLGEAIESYVVEVYTAGHAALLRTLTSATPAVTYTSAQQVTDFGSAPATLAIKVYQISATVGRGTALTVTI